MRLDRITHAIGIDISDGSLELANVQERRDTVPILTEYARVVLPEHVIVHGQIQDQSVLRDALAELMDKATLDPRTLAVCTALPDAQIVTKILPLPMSPAMPSYDALHRSATILYRSLKYRIPNPILRWTYRELPDTSGELTLFVARKDAVRQWHHFFKEAGISLVSIEMESLAIHRSLINKIHAGEAIILIDFGYRMTTLSVTDRTGLRYSHTIDQGGHDLTKLIAATMNVSLSQAEKLKVSVGLVGSGDEKLHALLSDEVSRLLKRISDSLTEYGQPITSVIITGGGARLRGIRTATEKHLVLATKRGIPWFSNLHTSKGQLGSSSLTVSEGQYYAGALGLAVRGMNRYTLAKGINFIES
jgi:type IV pilus assembly protein PilM